jgi:hypothetical protein
VTDHDTITDALLAGTLGVAEHGLPVAGVEPERRQEAAQEPVTGRYGVVGADGAWRPRREVERERDGGNYMSHLVDAALYGWQRRYAVLEIPADYSDLLEATDPDTESRQHILPHEGTTDWDPVADEDLPPPRTRCGELEWLEGQYDEDPSAPGPCCRLCDECAQREQDEDDGGDRP